MSVDHSSLLRVVVVGLMNLKVVQVGIFNPGV
jgi:hypothetical protein